LVRIQALHGWRTQCAGLYSQPAAIAMLAAGSLASNRAEAMMATASSGLNAAVEDNNLLQDVQVACRRVWRCGPYGCAGGGYVGALRHATAATATMAATGTVHTTAAIVVGGGN
ncbi:MAG: hypothetical protein WBY01_10035, partial [Pseudolabrys sp.]